MNSENYQIFENQLYHEWQKQTQMNILKKFRERETMQKQRKSFKMYQRDKVALPY